MATRQYRRFALFTLISMALWLGFLPLYDWLFAWTEYVPGINWIYLPHGLRVILVLLFGPAGALGFTIGAATYTRYSGLGPHLDPLLDLVLAVVPGLAVWLAVILTFRQWPGRSLQPWDFNGRHALNARTLLALAVVSAALNSTSHIMAHIALGDKVQDWAEHSIAMFIGDLFGALLLLYILKGCIFLRRKLTLNAIHHE